MKYYRLALSYTIMLFTISCMTEIGVSEEVSDIQERDISLQPRSLHSDSKPNLPYDDIVSSISRVSNTEWSNTYNFRLFSRYVSQINHEIANIAADSYNLTDEQKKHLNQYISENNIDIAKKYHQLLYEGTYSSTFLPSQINTSYPTYTNTRQFSGILSSYTCDLIQIALTLSIKKTSVQVGAITFKSLCEQITIAGLLPITEELNNRALLVDHLNSSVEFTEHIREMIFELATVEDYVEATEINTRSRRFLLLESDAIIEVQIKARVKAGFDLINYFHISINEYDSSIDVYLPKAEILSIDMTPIIKHLQDGWFINVDESQINEASAILRQRIKDRVTHSGILQEAESNAQSILKGILKPVFSSSLSEFQVNVHFVDEIEHRKF